MALAVPRWCLVVGKQGSRRPVLRTGRTPVGAAAWPCMGREQLAQAQHLTKSSQGSWACFPQALGKTLDHEGMAAALRRGGGLGRAPKARRGSWAAHEGHFYPQECRL